MVRDPQSRLQPLCTCGFMEKWAHEPEADILGDLLLAWDDPNRARRQHEARCALSWPFLTIFCRWSNRRGFFLIFFCTIYRKKTILAKAINSKVWLKLWCMRAWARVRLAQAEGCMLFNSKLCVFNAHTWCSFSWEMTNLQTLINCLFIATNTLHACISLYTHLFTTCAWIQKSVPYTKQICSHVQQWIHTLWNVWMIRMYVQRHTVSASSCIQTTTIHPWLPCISFLSTGAYYKSDFLP
jgi:hypothetical protein